MLSSKKYLKCANLNKKLKKNLVKNQAQGFFLHKLMI